MISVWTGLAIASAAGGVGLLWTTWRRRGGGWRLPAGWTAIIIAAGAWRMAGSAWDKAAALTLLTPSLLAISLIAFTADWRRCKARRVREAVAAEPPSAAPLWRGLVRTALTGPLAGGAALGLAVLTALRGPGEGADRLVAAGFVLPLAWAGCAVWATTDTQLLRIGIGLGALGGAAFGAVLL